MPSQEDLRKLWKEFFHHLYETSTYSELLFSCALSKSKNYVGEQTAQHNVEILKKYNYFFQSLEHGICYATVLSITQLFEDGTNKKKRTLAYFLDEAKKLKIDRDKQFEELKQKHAEPLEQLKTARDTYFAHREKGITKSTIPSSEKISELLNDIAELLNSVGSDFDNGGETYLWKKEEAGWSKNIQADFQHVLDNLYRGEAARLADIKVKYERKLYNNGGYDTAE